MADPFIGQIIAVGFNYPIDNWLPCDGRLVKITDYQALYALIGNTYGGDLSTTFGLPDLRGRAPIHQGVKPPQPTYTLGTRVGSETVTLTPANLPAHTHSLMASNLAATTNTPSSATVLATGTQTAALMYDAQTTATTMSASALGSSGGTASHENRQPYQVVNYIICTNGIFPQA